MIDLGERPSWQELASCHGQTDLFFPRQDLTLKGAVYASITKARKICEACPVRQQCLDYSLTLPHPWSGIYAGLTPRQRQQLKGQTL